MGSTLSAIIRIRNSTNSDITSVLVYDFDSFDFGYSRPDKAFNKVTIPSESCAERTIDFSVISSNCPFTMKLLFGDGTEDVFRMNYKCVFDGAEAQVKYMTKTHRLNFRKTGPRVLELVVENTEDQKENQKAEQLINQGCKLMESGKYNEASIKFMEAALKANENRTKVTLQKHSQMLKSAKDNFDVDKKAKTLNNEGMQLLKAVKFQDALKKFDEALNLAKNLDTITLIEDNLKIAKDAKANQDAKKLNQEGLVLMRNNQTEASVSKFDEALRIAVDRTLINSIKRHKAEALHILGKETLEEAWVLEMSASDEAIHKFAKAKFLFQEADSVKPSVDYQQSILLIECKIQGEKYFRAAVQLESEGSRLVDKTLKTISPKSCKVAKDKYGEAWRQYREAQKKFEEGKARGDGNFERSLKLTNQALYAIERILNELEKTELEIALVQHG